MPGYTSREADHAARVSYFRREFDGIVRTCLAYAADLLGASVVIPATIQAAENIRVIKEAEPDIARVGDLPAPAVHELLRHWAVEVVRGDRDRKPRLSSAEQQRAAERRGLTLRAWRSAVRREQAFVLQVMTGRATPEDIAAGKRPGDLIVDPAVVGVCDYLIFGMDDDGAAEFEQRLVHDTAFFEYVWPLMRAHAAGVSLEGDALRSWLDRWKKEHRDPTSRLFNFHVFNGKPRPHEATAEELDALWQAYVKFTCPRPSYVLTSRKRTIGRAELLSWSPEEDQLLLQFIPNAAYEDVRSTFEGILDAAEKDADEEQWRRDLVGLDLALLDDAGAVAGTGPITILAAMGGFVEAPEKDLRELGIEPVRPLLFVATSRNEWRCDLDRH